MPLQVAQIRKLEPKARRYSVFDGHRLGLEVMPSGLKVWRCHYEARGAHGVISLGRFPQISLADARKRHSEVVAAIRAGKSPADLRREERLTKERGVTVKVFAERYLTEHLPRWRKDVKPMRRYFERDVFPAIGDKPLATVELDAIRDLVFSRQLAGHDQAALALRNLLKRMWDYAVICGIADNNPLAAIPPKFVARPSCRSRALRPEEIGTFLRALELATIKRRHKIALQLILLTLTRKSELRLAQWKHVNLNIGEWEIPAENSKTNTAQIVYLSRQANDLFARLKSGFERSGFVFPAIHSDSHTAMAPNTLNQCMARISFKIEHFTVHDLRRTAATNLAEQEFNSDWIEKALNHKLKGIRGVYNRAQYATQRRQMLQAWADWLDEMRGKQ